MTWQILMWEQAQGGDRAGKPDAARSDEILRWNALSTTAGRSEHHSAHGSLRMSQPSSPQSQLAATFRRGGSQPTMVCRSGRGVLRSEAKCGLRVRFTTPGTVAILAQGANSGNCCHASLLRNKGKTFASVGIALSARGGRWSCCMHSPRRCFLRGPAGGRGRELLLNIMALEIITGKGLYQISVEVLHGGYAFDFRSTGAASSSEINFALGSRGNPASEQTVVDTSAEGIAVSWHLKFCVSNMFHKGALISVRPLPQPLSMGDKPAGLVDKTSASGIGESRLEAGAGHLCRPP